MLSRTDSPPTCKERGQVIVLFALLLPVILTIGSTVVSVGNWYVLKRHLQTQVDAAALAGGAVANGCQGDATQQLAARDKMKAEALKYAGDTARTATPPFNQQPEDIGDVRIVLNSTRFWDNPTLDPTDGSTLDWTMGNPCDTKSLDVKGTDYHVPLLFKWIPLFPSVKARALVEFTKTKNTPGIRPIGVPEFDPVRVFALFVDEGVSGASNPNSIVGRGEIFSFTPPSGDPRSQWNTWQGDVGGINLNNTSDHNVVILASRDPNVDPNFGNGSLSDVCNQDLIQTHCFGDGGTLQSGLSFIHVYSSAGGGATQATPPAPRDATLSGGCASDLSRPYFNLDGVDSNGNGCTLTLTAHVDFGTATPTDTTTCATLSIAGGSAMGYVGGDTWVGTYTLPSAPAGRFLMNLDWTTRRSGTGNCSGGQKWSGTLQHVAGAYVSDDKSDAVEYLTLENVTPGLTTTDGNSYPKTVSTSIKVTVGFVPPLRDTPLSPSTPPIRLRFEKGPSQTQALDCGAGAGPNGWNGMMASGCPPYQVNERTPTVNCTPPDLLNPPDCIASKNGNFNANGIHAIWASPCSATPNNWDGISYPPDSDPRWIPLFILDERSTTVAGKKYYPVRRFGGFYVTAGDGIDTGSPQNQCSGTGPNGPWQNDPMSTGRLVLWGHFVTYFTPDLGGSVPDDELCTFDDASLCILSLVE
jgi:Flp pilus assembly protein TadG